MSPTAQSATEAALVADHLVATMRGGRLRPFRCNPAAGQATIERDARP